MRTLRERCEAAEAEAASTRGQLANARRQLATLQEEASASGKQRSLFSAEAAALRARVEAGDAAVKRLNDELEAATLRVQGLEADLEEAQTERNRFATVNGQLEDVRLEMRKANQKATAAQAVRVLAAWSCSCSCAVCLLTSSHLSHIAPLASSLALVQELVELRGTLQAREQQVVRLEAQVREAHQERDTAALATRRAEGKVSANFASVCLVKRAELTYNPTAAIVTTRLA